MIACSFLVRTTLKAALPITPVKTGSSTSMTSQRSCSTASQLLARPSSSRSENKILSTRNTTKMGSRKHSPRGRVGDLSVSGHHTELFYFGTKLSPECNQVSKGAILVSCEIAASLFLTYPTTQLKVLWLRILLCALPSFHEYVRWRVTYVSDVGPEKKGRTTLPSSAMLQDLSHMDRITQLQDEIQRVSTVNST